MIRFALIFGFPLLACASTQEVTAPTILPQTEWTQTDYNGKSHDLGAAMNGSNPVVLVFWQTWCLSCLHEAPLLTAVAAEHPELMFLGVVSGDDDTVDAMEVRRVASEIGISYPQILDQDLSLTHALRIQGSPTIVVLGKDGRILERSHNADLAWSTFAP
jgi:thiol-disulfide isomerase/thioredoxin